MSTLVWRYGMTGGILRIFLGTVFFLSLAIFLFADDQPATKAEIAKIEAIRKLDSEGRLQDGVKVLQQLAKSKNEDIRIESTYYLGRFFYVTGKFDKAKEYWLPLQHCSHGKWQRQALLDLMNLYEAEGNLKEAVKFGQSLLAFFPTTVPRQ